MKQSLLLLGFGLCLPAAMADGLQELREPEHRTIRYTLSVRNLTGDAIRGATVRADAPVKRTATQETLSVTASHPFELTTDGIGNQSMAFILDLAPYASKIIAVEAVLAFPQQAAEGVAHAAIVGDSIPLAGEEDPEIQRVALGIEGQSPADVARGAFDWVTAHVSDSGYVAEDRGPLSALITKAGDCTEQASLFVALARARGIPARVMAGYLIDSSGVVRSGGYHDWAEFYVGGTWWVADPQGAVFVTSDARYVATRMALGRHPQPYRLADAIEVRMN